MKKKRKKDGHRKSKILEGTPGKPGEEWSKTGGAGSSV